MRFNRLSDYHYQIKIETNFPSYKQIYFKYFFALYFPTIVLELDLTCMMCVKRIDRFLVQINQRNFTTTHRDKPKLNVMDLN